MHRKTETVEAVSDLPPREAASLAAAMADGFVLLSERIVVGPQTLPGKPVIRETGLAVEFILDLLAAGESEGDIIENCPGLTREDILACLAYRRKGEVDKAPPLRRRKCPPVR